MQPASPGREALSAADRYDILDLYAEFAWALSLNDRDLLARTLADGVTVRIGDRQFQGKAEAVSAALAAERAALPIAPGCQHWTGELQVDHGRGGQLRARAFVATPMLNQIGTPASTLLELGTVEDRLTRCDGRWYFAARAFALSGRKGGSLDLDALAAGADAPSTARPASPVGPEDRAQIDELFARYAWALDRGEAEEFATLFTKDAVIEDPAGRFEGAAPGGIAAFIEDLRENNPTFRGRQHWISQTRLGADGDQITARSFTLVPSRQLNGATNVHLIAYYDDVLVRDGGDWRFRARIVRRWRGEILAGFPRYAPDPGEEAVE